MQNFESVCVASVRLSCAWLVLSLPQAAQAQAIPEPADEVGCPTSESRAIVLQGLVLTLDGNPAEGAVVVSSAGGRAVTDARGKYRLEVEVPDAASRVQLTARDGTGANLNAGTLVTLGRTSAATRVGPLLLGASCSPAWLPTFGQPPGMIGGGITATTTFDEGAGPVLHAAGRFFVPGLGLVWEVARWDGSGWTPLGSGMDSSVLALAAYDDGSGSALYAAGDFTTAGGTPASAIAKWDGSSWSPLGSGMNLTVQALAAYDDGNGEALYAGGWFTTAGGTPVNRIAKWNGTSWSALGSGMNSQVGSLAVRRRRRPGALCRWLLFDRGRRGRQPRGEVERHELVVTRQRDARLRSRGLAEGR